MSRPSGAVSAARPVVRESCRRAHLSAPRTSSGSAAKKASARARSERQLRRELPEHRPERSRRAAGRPTRRSSRAAREVRELEHVRDVSAALEREDEAARDGRAPRIARRGPRQRVEGAVDLDRRQPLGEVGQPALRRQPRRIEAAAPVGIDPAGGADANRSRHGARGRAIAVPPRRHSIRGIESREPPHDSLSRNSSRSLRDPLASGRGRDGRGVSRPGPPPGPRRRGQGPARRLLERPGPSEAIRAGGARRGRAQSPQHHRGPRPRHARRRSLRGPRAARGRDAALGARGAAASRRARRSSTPSRSPRAWRPPTRRASSTGT